MVFVLLKHLSQQLSLIRDLASGEQHSQTEEDDGVESPVFHENGMGDEDFEVLSVEFSDVGASVDATEKHDETSALDDFVSELIEELDVVFGFDVVQSQCLLVILSLTAG